MATDLQTQGRGRLGRTWETPPGRALLFSVLLHPRPPMAIWPELSLVAGDAVATALREQTGVAAELSHPNDVLIEGRKVAGILPEASSGQGRARDRRQRQPDGRRATAGDGQAARPSLRIETGREWPRAPLLAAILLELERRYDDWQRLHTNR